MGKRYKKSSLSVAKVFELIGKPAFFLFTIIVVGGVAYLRLLNVFVKRLLTIRLPTIRLPRLTGPKIRLPRFHVRYSVLLFSAFCFLLFVLCAYLYIFKDLPSPTELSETTPSLTTKIYDRNGELLYQIYKDQNRSLIKLSDLPSHVVQATLAAEDKNFYNHKGFDLLGIMRALYNNIVNCKLKIENCTLEGGSTITQQLVKNVLLNREKSITRKIKELVLSVHAETIYSKDQILEMYLNQVPYGGTAYGIEEASRAYFGKHASELNLAESALLAGLPVSPTTLSPYGVNPYLSIVRQHYVLDQMALLGYVSQEAVKEAKKMPLSLNPQGISIKAPHMVMYVKDWLVKQYGEDMVSRGGLTVTTTLDLQTQQILQNEIDLELDKLKKMSVSNAAGIVVDPQSGEILAMVGSKNFFDHTIDGQVNIVLQERQPGSSIKPITYALALLSGLSPSSTIDDAPICFRLKGQPDYCPKNYDGRFHGTVTLRSALANSYNIPAIKLLNALGVNNMVELARSMGITTWNNSSRYGLALTLGGGEVTMLDMAQVYGVLATGGYKTGLSPILSVRDASGNIIYAHTPQNTQVLPESIAYQISNMLADRSARANAFGYNSILNITGRDVAVKTGTTNNLRDNWTFGYTPNLLVATWVGNNDNTPMSSVASGITGASPIWSRTMTQLLKNKEPVSFTRPNNIVRALVSCTQPPRYDYFVKGTEPKINCEAQGVISDQAASTAL